MTSNQIAAAANAIELRKLDETTRHNVESENIERDKLRVDETYKARMASAEERKNALTEELGKLNIEWQSANESRKREIEQRKTDIDAELALIEQEKVDIDQQYKIGLITTKNLEVDETKRSNMARESIQDRANTIKAHEVDITDRSEMGKTPKSRAQIIQAAGGVKGPFGLASLGLFYGTESVLSATETVQNKINESKSSNKTKNESKAGTRSQIKFNDSWAQTSNGWVPARDR